MSYYKPCPDCGANLDPGENCDCRQKKNGLPDANQFSPKKGDPLADLKPSPKHNIAQSAAFVKTLSAPAPENPLRDLRVANNIPVKEMVSTVRELFPRYDKHLHSKCEHGETYGILLNPKAMDALRVKYAPAKKQTRHGKHKLTKRISCRLPDDLYEKFLRYSREDGYNTQDWLADMVGKYVKKKYISETYNGKKAVQAQAEYCQTNHVPRFAPYAGICHRCFENIYYPHERPDGTVTGITIEQAGKWHITHCPHCEASFID